MKNKGVAVYAIILIFFVLSGALINIQATTLKSATEKLQDSVYVKVDKVPVFKKKRGNLQKYLSKHINYPIDALAKEIEGKVLVSFVINTEGELINARIIRGLHPGVDKEALKVVSELKDWKPGEVNGSPVSTKVTIPVHFYISDENREIAKQLKPFYINDSPPLFVIDKRKVTGLTTLEYFNIKSIRVIKGAKAVELYGEEAKNGVLVVETKNGTEPFYQRY